MNETRREAIRLQLDRILQSPPFNTSKRSQAVLRFIVEKTLAGEAELLKERTIGVDVFHREPGYDTNRDAVVRIAANELRKRLAQYEIAAGPDDGVRILLPAGSYVPEFRWPAGRTDAGLRVLPAPVVPSGLPKGTSRRLPWRKPTVLAGIALCLLATLALGIRSITPRPALEQFWAPVLQSQAPASITIGQSAVYLLSERIHRKYCGSHHPEVEAAPHVVPFAEASIPATDIIPITDRYTNLNDAIALGRLMEMFARFEKPVKIRLGSQTSFSDLRDAPAILLGFNNRWNQEIARDLRFTFDRKDGIKRMTDSTPPGRTWEIQLDGAGLIKVDYALVSRVFGAGTGQLVVQAGGLGWTGTRAAGEFLTDERSWKGFLDRVPRDWASRNLQIVIRVKVLGNTPGTPEIVAVHCW